CGDVPDRAVRGRGPGQASTRASVTVGIVGGSPWLTVVNAEENKAMHAWLMLLPVGGLGWWLAGFPPGWGWVVAPMLPSMPVSLGMVLVLATVVIGAYGGLIWFRNNV